MAGIADVPVIIGFDAQAGEVIHGKASMSFTRWAGWAKLNGAIRNISPMRNCRSQLMSDDRHQTFTTSIQTGSINRSEVNQSQH
jgi:hypothetical protein